jgi:DEAD/DEAH box helicase domain-containing protein
MAKLTMKEWLPRMEMNRHFMENVRSLRRLPASEGRFSNFPDWIHPKLRLVLEKRGIRQLFSHQAEAIQLVRNGRPVVLVTPTPSGKTLCYNLPVLKQILEAPEHVPFIFSPQKPSLRTRCMKYTV